MRAFVGVGVALAVLAVVGCGGSSEREYGLPSSLCGVDMDQSLYEALFPPGDDLDVLHSFEDYEQMATRHCEINVDDETVLRVDAEGRESFEEFGLDSLGVDMADAESVSGEFEAVVWPGVAMATAACAVPGPGGHNYIDQLTLVLEAEHPGDADESRRVLADVIQPLFAGALAMTPCAENAAR
ncbi:hypothetical protein [Streptomyces johnsoniae]|uniref:Lipoprotein n=1 Tax=Streptomyces johnsoniae TaxID=3075532 RepID=A0ABU2SBT3_9ACTN|nr:hypothetical protein [Streptomyces sp. DSM 41886]MDT0445864.1 hypothetical protein [Streptomyces sp. DSM 41886]